MNLRIVAGVAAVGIAIIALILVLTRGSEMADHVVVGSTPEVTPSVVSTTTTPAATSKDEAAARNIKLVEVNGMLTFATDPRDVPLDASGAFYLNIETGRLEGWYWTIKSQFFYAFSDTGRFTAFEVKEPILQGEVTYAAGQYLADRKTHKVYRWDGNAQLVLQEQENGNNAIADSEGLVLFRVSVEDGDDWFSLLNVDTGDVEAVFPAEAEWGLISQDGRKVALVGADARPDVFVADVASGDVNHIGEVMLDGIDLEGEVRLMDGRDTETFTFAANPAKARFSGIAARFTWAGEQVSQVAGAKVFVSPRGDYVATIEPVAIMGSGQEAPWYVFNAFDLRDGSPVFRVVGAAPGFGYWRGNRWLADGSGLVVERPDRDLVVAMWDGSLSDFVGVPSPDSPDVFAVNGGAVDSRGMELARVTFPGGFRDFTEPWGNRGDEVRMLVNLGGHDGPGLTASIVEPHVEEAPYAGKPQLQISEAGVAAGLVKLYDEPGGTVVGQVEAPYRVQVEDVVMRCTGDFETYGDVEDCPQIDSTAQENFVALMTAAPAAEGRLLAGFWTRVTTADGRQGWMLLQVQGIGI